MSGPPRQNEQLRKFLNLFRKNRLVFIVAISTCLLYGSCASKDSIRKRRYERPSASSSQQSAVRHKYHVIKKGETLYGIAKKYGVSVKEIQRINRIKDARDIDVGRKIYIPRRSKSVSSRPKRVVKPKYTSPKASVRFVWPVKRVDISSRYGARTNGRHDGIDLRARKGTPIYAAARGKVIFSGTGPTGYGKMIIIKHDKRTITIYAHNQRNLVKKNRFVKRGQKIGEVGRSGRATGYHVHFEIRINRKPVNPEKYLPRR